MSRAPSAVGVGLDRLRADSMSLVDPNRGAGLLHRLTSFGDRTEADRQARREWLRSDLLREDPRTMPPPFKTYDAALPVVPLPRDLPRSAMGATAVLAGAEAAPGALDVGQLARLLFLSAGVVRRTRGKAATTPWFRAAGSAGGRAPYEVYVCSRDISGLVDGTYWYDALGHALVRIGDPALDGVASVVVTGVAWRTCWRYGERGWRHVFWDVGTMVSQLLSAAHSVGVPARLVTRFPDTAVGRLVGADGDHEYAVAVLPLAPGAPATRRSGFVATGELPQVDLPLCVTALRAGDRHTLEDSWPAGPPLPGPAPPSATIDDVIRSRGSQRRMDPSRGVSRSVLEWSMRAAMRGVDVPHRVVVHDVAGMASGIYAWPDLDHPIRAGLFRDDLRRAAVGQALAGDASYVVIAALDGRSLDDHGYREAQIAAGLVEGRLHLASYALGATASGMTFRDSKVRDLLGASDHLVTLLLTCVGIGAYRARPGGEPGHPTEVWVSET